MKRILISALLLLTACESYETTETVNSKVQITNVSHGAKGAVNLVLQQIDAPQTYEVTVYQCSSDSYYRFHVGDKIYYPLSHRKYDEEHSSKDGYYFESANCDQITLLSVDN